MNNLNKKNLKLAFVLLVLNVGLSLAQKEGDCINEYKVTYEDCQVFFAYESEVNAIIIDHPAECKNSNLLLDYQNIEKLVASIDLAKYCDKMDTIIYLFERDEEDVKKHLEIVKNKLIKLFKMKFDVNMVVCDESTAYIQFMKNSCDE